MGKVGVAGEGYPLAIEEVFDGESVCKPGDLTGRMEGSQEVGRSDRQNVLYVVKKQLVLKNTGRFVQEHNCSSDEAISEPGI